MTSDAPLLDLASDDRDSYAGKRVVLFGREYEIGEHLGTGGEKCVHRLKNLATGRQSFVIRIWGTRELRDEAHRRRDEFIRRLILRPFELGGPSVTIATTIEHDSHGGVFQTQKVLAKPVPDAAEIVQGLSAAARHLSADRLDAAVVAYDGVLARAPCHPMALHNRAIALWEAGRAHEAFDSMARATEVEPCDEDHIAMLTRFASGTGRYGLAAHLVEAFVARFFPFDPAHDDLLVRDCLEAGAPETARAFLVRRFESLGLRPPPHDLSGVPPHSRLWMYAKLHRLCEGAEAAAASAVETMATAKKLTESGAAAEAARLLAHAHASAPQDPILEANLAICLAQSNEFEKASSHFYQAARQVEPPLHGTLLANAAFCLLARSEVEAGVALLDRALSELADENGQLSDVPCVLGWVAPGVTEEDTPASALHLLASVAPVCPPELRERLATIQGVYEAYARP